VRRQQFITVASGAAIAWPLAARAQEDRAYRVGILNINARRSAVIMALFDELRRNGLAEGRNLLVQSSGIEQPCARFPDLAREMLKANVEVLFVGGGAPPVRSVQAVAPDMPLISVVDDMVAEAVVQSLARPGGNVTGVSILAPELDSKRQQLLMELSRPGGEHEAAGISQFIWRRACMASCCTHAATREAADHRVLGLGHSFGQEPMGRRFCAAAA
jgi:ABC-type uncharacterized transport system substrate-binding protein